MSRRDEEPQAPCVMCGKLFSFDVDRLPDYQGLVTTCPICRAEIEGDLGLQAAVSWYSLARCMMNSKGWFQMAHLNKLIDLNYDLCKEHFGRLGRKAADE